MKIILIIDLIFDTVFSHVRVFVKKDSKSDPRIELLVSDDRSNLNPSL